MFLYLSVQLVNSVSSFWIRRPEGIAKWKIMEYFLLRILFHVYTLTLCAKFLPILPTLPSLFPFFPHYISLFKDKDFQSDRKTLESKLRSRKCCKKESSGGIKRIKQGHELTN